MAAPIDAYRGITTASQFAKLSPTANAPKKSDSTPLKKEVDQSFMEMASKWLQKVTAGQKSPEYMEVTVLGTLE